jgi:hypothetical protein
MGGNMTLVEQLRMLGRDDELNELAQDRKLPLSVRESLVSLQAAAMRAAATLDRVNDKRAALRNALNRIDCICQGAPQLIGCDVDDRTKDIQAVIRKALFEDAQ